MILRFVRENNQWFIDLPEWEGEKADLQMVLGADTLLDVLSNRGYEVSLDVSLEKQDEDYLKLSKIRDCEVNGADYVITSIGHELWLCDVTKFVFGGLPKTIYVKPVY